MLSKPYHIAHIADYYYAVQRQHEKLDRLTQATNALRKANRRYKMTEGK